MKKILFLTYYYPPANATGANRPGSFAKNFAANGYSVTVVTRQWTGREKNWKDQLDSNITSAQIVNTNNIAVHYLPYKRYEYPRITKFNTLKEHLRGNFNYELAYDQFENYVLNLCKNDHFDFILVSIPPNSILKTAYKVGKLNNIPLLLDIRDFQNDIILKKNPPFSISNLITHQLVLYYFKKWLSQTKAVVTASPVITEYINKTFRINAVTLTNGFNEELLQIEEDTYKDNFTISVLGSLHKDANLDEMKKLFVLLFDKPDKYKLKFNFIGLTINPSVANEFARLIPAENLLITDRMPQNEALQIGAKSHVLMLAGYDNYKGALTTKVFEYLGLRKPVLLIPSDNDVIEALLNETGAGFSPPNAEEAYKVILNWYNEWQNTGSVSFNGELDKILNYSRENQFKKILKLL
ncbi:hypothetical protein [Terrimonas alba]|uniref:hypothetical protein n=1 Tax=Terrimonas alba TaxID=3349636 RepID=UPI0035F42D46